MKLGLELRERATHRLGVLDDGRRREQLRVVLEVLLRAAPRGAVLGAVRTCAATARTLRPPPVGGEGVRVDAALNLGEDTG